MGMGIGWDVGRAYLATARRQQDRRDGDDVVGNAGPFARHGRDCTHWVHEGDEILDFPRAAEFTT